MVSEYEVKRLRRMEENRRKLQSLELPTFTEPTPRAPTRKRKREPDAKPLEPTRKSSRMRKKRKLDKQQRRKDKELRKMEKAQVQMEKHLHKLEKKKRREEKQQRKKDKVARNLRKLRAKLEHKKLKHQHKLEGKVKREKEEEEKRQKKKKEKMKEKEERKRQLEVEVQEKMVEVFGPPLHTQPRIEDWRLRRKLLRQEEERRISMRKRLERREQRLQEKIKEKKKRLWKRELARRERKTARRIKLERQTKEKEQRRLERDEMRREDRLARELVRFEAKQEKRRRLEARYAVEDQEMWEKVLVHSKRLREEAKQEHEDMYRERYPIRKCDALPFVQMSGTIQPTSTKPLVVTPLLNIETTLFHAFSLGKQFLPPGKESVMQALCPGGYTPLFAEDSDIHIWKNGMALFVPCTSGMYIEYLFREARLGREKFILFPWRRCREVTPFHLWHLSQVQRGEEAIRFNDNYYLTPSPAGKPLPLLLFVQYPNGPYVYFGRLGYLGYRLTPDIEFSFQLLDIDTLNWRKMRRYFIDADKDRFQKEKMKDEAAGSDALSLSQYEVKRRRRVEENRRVLQALNLPTLSRRSSRPASKTHVTLEATRRSSRQEERRAVAEREEHEKEESETRIRKQQEEKLVLQKQQRELKRKQQELKQQQVKKKKKVKDEEDKRKQEVRERKLEEIRRIQEQEWKRQQEQQRRRQQQQQMEKQNELPPEIVAERNAGIQKFIQEELDKQARLARERKQQELERQTLIAQEAERLKQEQLQRQSLMAKVAEEGDAGVTAAEVAAASVETAPGEFEFEFVF
ncbi:hypothetical protein KRP22_006270 [Phytophthora ramorum]|nr:Reticulocyte-binding protein 2-like protein a [Phytophthora ramorum]